MLYCNNIVYIFYIFKNMKIICGNEKRIDKLELLLSSLEGRAVSKPRLLQKWKCCLYCCLMR